MTAADDAGQLAAALADISRAVARASSAAGQLAAADPTAGHSAEGLALVYELDQLTASARLAGLVNPWRRLPATRAA